MFEMTFFALGLCQTLDYYDSVVRFVKVDSSCKKGEEVLVLAEAFVMKNLEL